MARRVRKITPSFLKKMIVDEAKKLRLETLETGVTDVEKVEAEEVDADEYADSLEKDIDHVKALQIHERRLSRKLKAIREANQLIKNKGKMLVRKSGTEPKIRIMGESENRILIQKCINIVRRTIK